MLEFETLEALPRQGGGDEVQYLCPKCYDTEGHLYVNWRKRLYICFKCGIRGKVPRDILAPLQTIPVVKRDEEGAVRPDTDNMLSNSPYLQDHNITTAHGEARGVRNGRLDWRGRIIFPARWNTQHGVTDLFYSAHAVRPGLKPKSIAVGKKVPLCYAFDSTHYEKEWLPAPDLLPGRGLWEHHREVMILVEGPADALRISNWPTYPDWYESYAAKGYAQDTNIFNWRRNVIVCCLFGKQLTDEWTLHLSKLAKDFVVMLDNDSLRTKLDGVYLAEQVEVFAHGRVQVVHQSSAEDPASMDDETLWQRIVKPVVTGEIWNAYRPSD